ncbi:MAG: HNH endonuclease [Patescibacteria group bacterium]|nr:HNH endonuclease [Patescibacteria group bacterium]
MDINPMKRRALLYIKFFLFKIPISIRIGCRLERHTTEEEAVGDCHAGEVAVYCAFCEGWHAQQRTASKKARIIEKQEGKCLRCGKVFGEKLTIHHIVPKSKGGSNNLANLAGYCRPCHTVEDKKTLYPTLLTKRERKALAKKEKARGLDRPSTKEEKAAIREQIIEKYTLAEGIFAEKLEEALKKEN